MKAVLLSLALMAAGVPTLAAGEPVKVFIFTNEVPSGSVDEQLKARRESVQDLVKILSSPRYQKTLTVVKSREGADVSVELLSRGETTAAATSSATRAAGGATASASRSATVTKQFLKFRMTAGQQAHDLTTENQLSWPRMAERAAEDIVKWIASASTPVKSGRSELALMSGAAFGTSQTSPCRQDSMFQVPERLSRSHHGRIAWRLPEVPHQSS
jgi:hypothetical protein